MSDDVRYRKKIDVESRQRSSRETATSSSDMSANKSSDESSVRCKGSKESSVYKSSDEFFEYMCDPCSSAGERFEAEGFCIGCGEYLCGTCFRSHSRGKTTKHHRLLNKDNMPRKQVQSCDPCKSAGEEIEAMGYSTYCREYLCSSCFKSHSRSKATKHHKLMDKDKMPQSSYSAVASAFARIDIHKEDARYQEPKEEYSNVRYINVEAEGDVRDCYIVAMTLVSNHELVLADYNNVSLKLVDVERNVIEGILVLKSTPQGLTTVSQNAIAVSLPYLRVIQIVKISRTIYVQRNIKVAGLCLGIEYINGKIYASFWQPVYFQIFHLSSTACETITPDAEVLKHCVTPQDIAVSPNESVIYVSDAHTSTFMCIDMNGNMISRSRETGMPRDIVITPFGSVYLCIRYLDVICKLLPDLREGTDILGPENGLIAPEAMCFNFAKQRLYISSSSGRPEICNHLKVYQWQ